jgi:GxxExxY protein
MTELLYKEEVHAIIGAAMTVHRIFGCGYLEAVYQEALEMELKQQGIPFVAAREFNICYKGQQLKKTYIADLLAYGKIIVELKALDKLTPREEAQVIDYLKVSGMEVGLLFNFGAESLEWERKILSHAHILRANSRNSRIMQTKT